jgi:hypothetical protein
MTTEWIVESASVRTALACAQRRVLAVQDTSEVNFARSARRRGLGPGGDGKTLGFFLHPVIAVDVEEKAVLGLVGAQIWTRAAEPVEDRARRSLEEKESLRWVEGARMAAGRLTQAAQLIVVGDREADIWDCFARRPVNAELLIRARHDRRLAGEGSLFAAARNWPETSRHAIEIAPRKIGEKARRTMVAVRAGMVRIMRPGKAPASDPVELELGLVEVREIDPPTGVEPVLWRLLTSLPVEEPAAAREIPELYCLRWRIEELFRIVKSDGLKLENSQVQESRHLFRLSALALAAAVRIIQLVDARDGSSRPMTDVLDEQALPAVVALGKTLEGATARQQNPHPEGSLAWLSWIVARYGGWNCYGKPPGPKTMAHGWRQFSATLAGLLIAQKLP